MNIAVTFILNKTLYRQHSLYSLNVTMSNSQTDLSRHIKRLTLPPTFTVPKHLQHDTLTAEPLTRAHVLEDLEAVNDSGATIRATRGGSWPSEILTEDFNFLDLAWHEREFRDRISFAYAMRDNSVLREDGKGEYVGCFYLNPLGARVPLSEELLEKYDVDVCWWVTTSAFAKGMYAVLYEGLKKWLKEDFPFDRPLFSNVVIPGEERSGKEVEIFDV